MILIRRRVPPLLLLLLVATACSGPGLASAFTRPDELSTLISLRDALRGRGGGAGDIATATWICDDTECDPCGDIDGDGWGKWRYIGCRRFSGAPKGVVTNVHLTGASTFYTLSLWENHKSHSTLYKFFCISIFFVV